MIAEGTSAAPELFATEGVQKPAAASNANTQPQSQPQCLKSTDELVHKSCCLSVQRQRAFTGKAETGYESAKALEAALAEAKQALPLVKSAYQPTGQTTITAAILMIAAAPVVLLILLGVCGGLCWGWGLFRSSFSGDDSIGGSRVFGLLALGLDLLLVVIMVFIPMICYGTLSKTFKNRNAILPAVLTGAIDLLVATALFVPMWKGETLAPTHLTFMLIPIRWVLIVIGGIVVPLIGAAAVASKIAEQKFCERTGVYLKRFAEAHIAFDYAENALELLRRGHYAAASRLARASGKSTALVTLWWEQGAETAFVELQLRFNAKYFMQRAGSGTPREKSVEWLAFSIKLDGSHAEQASREWAGQTIA